MIREERRKKRRRKHILIGFLTTLLILALAALIVIKVFTVKNVEVEGNKLYSDEQIKEWVLNDDYSWNTLYVYFKYRFFDTQEVPFIDTMEVSVKSPHTLHVEDEFDPTKYNLDYDSLPVMDKWLLSKLNSVVKAVDENLASYKIPESARALQEFVDEMSNWYVRRSRERFWAKGMEQDKINAYMTLYHALVTIAKTAAPMIPFMTEDIYQNLVRSVDKDAPESIHLCDFPTVNEAWIDKDLEADMKELLEIVVLGRACRNTANIKNRQPIGTMYVKAEKKMSEFYTDIIADELNVKEVKFADDVESFISYSFKPQLRTVGPKYGKLLGGIRQALTDINGTAAMNELRTNGVLKLDINGNDVELTEEDLLIETAQTEGYVSESDGETSVVLDTNLTPELIEEGFVREIISKIQTMRKEAGFEVMDKIVVYAHGNDKIQDVMKTHEDEIKSEVLADEMVLGETDGYVKEWNINKEAVTMGVKKL